MDDESQEQGHASGLRGMLSHLAPQTPVPVERMDPGRVAERGATETDALAAARSVADEYADVLERLAEADQD
ncbi:hypothetical protein [Demequina sp. NBRC 110054]|uniref:hypothetical protein n=1 Tax=Demequina sp. NBRC 110054 TaxID=1570343 RepID=UPI000A076E88|nr:hypothetical protein [Demequina sp. NBRC 110054]